MNYTTDYEYGICGKCGNFLTDCTCHISKKDKKRNKKRNTRYSYLADSCDVGICPECLQDVDDCLCLDTDFISTDIRYYDSTTNNWAYPAFNAPLEFSSFEELKKKIDSEMYTVQYAYTGSHVTLIAPHGGTIEPGTDTVIKELAKDNYNFYLFSALVEDKRMHITSHLFDDVDCLNILSKSKNVITIHGSANTDDIIYIGGLCTTTKTDITSFLINQGFKVEVNAPQYKGEHKNNLCNRGITGKGLQIEIPDSIRSNNARLRELTNSLSTFVKRYYVQNKGAN